MKHSLYALADWASRATILGLPVLVIGLFISARSAVSSRQRDLGERLRKVLRCVSKACDDYAYADRRNAVAVAFRDAAEQLDEIHDEGILSPNRRQIRELRSWVYDSFGRAHTVANFSTSIGSMVGPQERDTLKQNLEGTTPRVISWVGALSAKYLRATTSMDNGNILTYWRYRVLPPFIFRRLIVKWLIARR
jgi:hypothetical protein